jgi:hypothetical protein
LKEIAMSSMSSKATVGRTLLAATIMLLLTLSVYAQDPHSHVPRYFYRIGMLDWSKLKNISGDSKRMFNLFLSEADAFGFYETEYSGADDRIYRFTKEDLAKTPDGRAFLDEVEQEMRRNPDRVDMTVMFSDEQAFKETILNIAANRVFYDAPPRERRPGGRASLPAGPADEIKEKPPEPLEREVAPAAVEPALETKIENFLRSIDLKKLEDDLKAGNFEIFKNPLFAPTRPTDITRWRGVGKRSARNTNSPCTVNCLPKCAGRCWSMFLPKIVYTYTSERINSDMVEQALRSRRVPGKQAERICSGR